MLSKKTNPTLFCLFLGVLFLFEILITKKLQPIQFELVMLTTCASESLC